MEKSVKKSYFKLLKERKQQSRVYTPHQMTGLALAEILEDNEHKSLYMRLAKKHGEQFLMEVAKDVASREGIENKGAYFMKVLAKKIKEQKSGGK